jgi:TPP-dependent 2-oxoacid decarboxylase
VYGVEEFLEKNALLSYNDLADWGYADVAKAMGCKDWIIEKVSTVGELVKQLNRARDEVKGAYIEVMMNEKLLDALTSSALSMEYMDAPSTH